MRRRKLYGRPHTSDRDVVLPGAWRLPFRRCRESEGTEHQGRDSARTRERKSICPKRVNQVSKNDGHAEQVAAAGAEARRQKFRNAASGEEQKHGKAEG